MIHEQFELIALIEFVDGTTDEVKGVHPFHPQVLGQIDYQNPKTIKSFRVRAYPAAPLVPADAPKTS